MRYREITTDQAEKALAILREECGYTGDPYDGRGFIRAIVTADKTHVCDEFRFIGALGFGGKFRNNGNCENTPHVDCYSENKTPERLAMIKRANARLAELFPPVSP
jgi:hypothetical protein